MKVFTIWMALVAGVLLGPLPAMAEPASAPEAGMEAAPEAPVEPAGPVVEITTKYGVIAFETFPDDAPKTVARILKLVRSGFYNGLVFHRVVPGFVIQGGDPQGTGRGGSGQNIPAEFNGHKHVPGTVAMARLGDDVNSADSQFYIALDRLPQLDGSYTVFGQVIEGMDVVRKVKRGDVMKRVTVRK